MSTKVLTQRELKLLMSEVIGDGQEPNMFFVSTAPYYRNGDGDAMEIPNISNISELWYPPSGPFYTYEEAREKYDEIELSEKYGIGEVIIEDRKTGTITEKFLREKITLVEDEFDYAHYFGYTK